MAHKRKSIRASIVTELINAATAAGSNVFNSRSIPLFDDQMPSICVYTLSEQIVEPLSNVRILRDLFVRVEGAIEKNNTENFADTLDDLAEEIEAALNSFTPGCANSEMELQRTDIEYKNDGERTKAAISLTYNVKYATNKGD